MILFEYLFGKILIKIQTLEPGCVFIPSVNLIMGKKNTELDITLNN